MRTPQRADGRIALAFVGLSVVALSVSTPMLWRASGVEYSGPAVLVTDVIDGDTIRIMRGSELVRVRLKCVDTPETVHPTKPVQFYGPEASAYTKKLLTGKWVRIESDIHDQWDRYGRLLAYVFLEDGRLFNLDLLREGYARTTRFPCRFKHEAADAEHEAQVAGRGIWSTSTLSRAVPAKVSGPIIANRRSRVYHLPNQATSTTVSERNRVYFETEEEARRAGYRRARR